MSGTDYPLYLLLLIPVISGVIGYVTNVAAVKMMFYPSEFVGIKPYLGWRGIIPTHAVHLAKTSLHLVTSQILKFKDLFAGVDPATFLTGTEKQIEEMTRRAVDKQATAHFSAMWTMLPEATKNQVYTMAFDEVRAMSVQVIGKVLADIEDLADAQRLIVRVVRERPTIISQIFLQVGGAEFTFIERSGLYFGFLFGLVQLVMWIIYPVWWVLPFFGFLVGWVTNWLAIKLIFEPKEPKRILGLKVQGLFHRRQKEVAFAFGNMVTEHIFTDDNIFGELTKPESRSRILGFVDEESKAMVDRYRDHPLAKGVLTDALIEEVQAEVMSEVESEIFRRDGMLSGLSDKSEAIRETLQTKMADMPSDDFENVLRPAFQQDEWKLILAGAVLGLVAGVLQLVFLFGEALTNM